jgi:hypothetical protein
VKLIADWLIERARRRAPDFIIGGKERPYLLRWFLIPRNPVFNVYLHQFLRSDDDRAHHDHPWLFNASVLLRGCYVEHTIESGGVLVQAPRSAGAIKFRWGAAPHRLALVPAVGDKEWPCWTLFITGPRVREWGFYCMERGWVHWKRFTAADDSGAVGKGCDA